MKKRKDKYLVQRLVLYILAWLLIILGIIFLFDAFVGITGFSINDKVPKPTNSVAGIIFLSSGLSLLYVTKQKKAQAAMEFLMTYGWAILAMIIALSTLAYWSFNADIGNNTILLSPPLYAKGVGVNDQGGGIQTVQFEIANNGAQNIYLQDAKIEGSTNCPTANLADALLEPGKTTIINFVRYLQL